MKTDQFTLTSKLGAFFFPKKVKLSHAKLIRDTCTGQYFAPKQGVPAVWVEADCGPLIHSMAGPVSDIDFEVEFR